jgi:hypothetical protein
MRLPRMTTRRWMVVVALVAAVIAGIRFAERRSYCLRQAELWSKGVSLANAEAELSIAETTGNMTSLARVCIEERDVCRLKELEYRRAARYPWLPVPTGPPPPE